MRAVTQVYEGGFSDAVLNSQEVFRALDGRYGQPGPRNCPIAQSGRLLRRRFSPVAASVAATLFDHDATVWCDKAIAGSDGGNWLAEVSYRT